ncbi:hypothetical protein [Kineosporia mesophila]|uniref:hypothetical protein n=1 Tax=Kineosporia mesophila TaxID=566012 RepID=UPI001E426E1C|nr:hypothetical protein [Kineosporia mesophila]MCD5352993.1 hypothetical protein [Kineosporia mesophila]
MTRWPRAARNAVCRPVPQLMHEQVMSAGHLTEKDLSEMVDEVLAPVLRSGAGGGTVAG